MGYLFDTDAISEIWRPRPQPGFIDWLRQVPREAQFTSAITVGELYKGAFRSSASARYVAYIEERLLPNVGVLPVDVGVAAVYGHLRAKLEAEGLVLEDADLFIAATAVHHGLALVTGNVAHFERVTGLRLERVLADARRR